MTQQQNIKQRVGNQIREARRAKGLTLKELGDTIGIAESTLSLYESGKQNLTLETLQKVADALGLRFDTSFK